MEAEAELGFNARLRMRGNSFRNELKWINNSNAGWRQLQ